MRARWQRPWLAAWAALAACAPAAPRPPAPPPTLEEAVAPEAVRPELAEVLSAMLRRGEGDFVLPLGGDHARCSLRRDERHASLDCGDRIEEAADVASIVKKIHTGEVGTKIVVERLADDLRFAEHVGLKPGPLRVRGEGWIERDQGAPLAVVRFEVLEGGAAVRAKLEGAEGPEEKQAGSLLELGRWLSERSEALPLERASLSYRASLRQGILGMLPRVTRGDKGWELDGVRLGAAQSEQPSIAAVVTEPRGSIGQLWPRRYRQGAFNHGKLDAPLNEAWSHFEVFDGRVASATQVYRWAPQRPANEFIDCEALTRWLASQSAGFAPVPEVDEAKCVWRRREEGAEIELSVSQDGQGALVVTLLDAAREALEAKARAQIEAKERAEVCRVCAQLVPGQQVHIYYQVARVDFKACKATLRAISSGMGGDIKVGSEYTEPCDARNTYE